jgi:hypothetical protein
VTGCRSYSHIVILNIIKIFCLDLSPECVCFETSDYLRMPHQPAFDPIPTHCLHLYPSPPRINIDRYINIRRISTFWAKSLRLEFPTPDTVVTRDKWPSLETLKLPLHVYKLFPGTVVASLYIQYLHWQKQFK